MRYPVSSRARVSTGLRIPSRRFLVWSGRLAVIVAVLAGWASLASLSGLVPSISATAEAFARIVSQGEIAASLTYSMRAVFGGFLVAAVAGLPAGSALGRSTFLRQLLDPVIAALFAVPRVVLYPVLLAIFGIGVTAELWMAALSAFFPLVITTTAAVRDVSPTLIRVGRSMNCTRWQLASKVYLPAAAPSVMTGLRLAFSVAFVNVIIAELFASRGGLGQVVGQAYALQQLPRMFAIVALIFAIAVVGNLALWIFEQRLRAAD